jgi:hypothetical protein
MLRDMRDVAWIIVSSIIGTVGFLLIIRFMWLLVVGSLLNLGPTD